MNSTHGDTAFQSLINHATKQREVNEKTLDMPVPFVEGESCAKPDFFTSRMC